MYSFVLSLSVARISGLFVLLSTVSPPLDIPRSCNATRFYTMLFIKSLRAVPLHVYLYLIRISNY